MKDSIILGLLLVLMFVCVSCKERTTITEGNPDGEYIAFFQFKDTSYLHKVLATPIKYCENNPALYYMLGRKWAIGTYPKLFENEPLFRPNDVNRVFFDGSNFDLQTLITESKYIALHDGFYICFPFALLEREGIYLDVNWKDMLVVNFDTVNVNPATYSPYNKRYIISEKKLAELTGKSTLHFHNESEEQVSIQDAINIINWLIENNELDKHCTVMYSDIITYVER